MYHSLGKKPADRQMFVTNQQYLDRLKVDRTLSLHFIYITYLIKIYQQNFLVVTDCINTIIQH